MSLAGGAEEAGRDRQRLKGEHAAHALPVLGFVMPHLRFGFGTLRDAERAPRDPGFRIGLRHGDPFADEIPGKPVMPAITSPISRSMSERARPGSG